MTVIPDIADAPRVEPEEAGHHTGAHRYYRDPDGALYRLEPADIYHQDYEHIRIEAMQPGDIYAELSIDRSGGYHRWLHVQEVNGQLHGLLPITAEDIGAEPDICPGCGNRIGVPGGHWNELYKGRLYHLGHAPRVEIDCPDCNGTGEITRCRELRGWFRTWPAVKEPCDCARVRGTPGKIRVLAP